MVIKMCKVKGVLSRLYLAVQVLAVSMCTATDLNLIITATSLVFMTDSFATPVYIAIVDLITKPVNSMINIIVILLDSSCVHELSDSTCTAAIEHMSKGIYNTMCYKLKWKAFKSML